jgi:capsular polysaccharide export protein
VTRLPCPPEVLIERMARGEAEMDGPLVRLRMMQGRVRKALGF